MKSTLKFVVFEREGLILIEMLRGHRYECIGIITVNQKLESATVGVIKLIADGTVVPVFSKEILKEYNEVLHRKKFISVKNIFSV